MARTEEDETYFKPENLQRGCSDGEYVSPSGKYRLVVSTYSTTAGSWNYTRGQVSTATGEAVADIKRNYGEFPFMWIEGHPNGHDYLVTGQDYEGQTVVELDTGRRRDHDYHEKDDGDDGEVVDDGFCWISQKFEADSRTLVVFGCIWAFPHEFRFYDFSDPMSGWPLLSRRHWIDAERDWPEFEGRTVRVVSGGTRVLRVVRVEPQPDTIEDSTVFRSGGPKPGEIGPWESWVTSWPAYLREGPWEVCRRHAPETPDGPCLRIVRRRGVWWWVRRPGVRFVKTFELGKDDMTQVDEWVSAEEQARREERARKKAEQDAWWSEYKATNPLYLKHKELVSEEPFRPEPNVWLGYTTAAHQDGEDRNISRRIHDDGSSDDVDKGLRIDLEWGVDRIPIRLTVCRDKERSEMSFDRSPEGMAQAFEHARRAILEKVPCQGQSS